MRKKDEIIDILIERGAEFHTMYRMCKFDKDLCRESNKNSCDSEYYETSFWNRSKAINLIIVDITQTEKEQIKLLDTIYEKLDDIKFLTDIYYKYELIFKNAEEIKDCIEDGRFKYLY